MSPRICIPHAIYEAMLSHVRAEFPNEACGLLRGSNGRVSDLLPAQNTALTPRSDYQVDAQTLLRALAWEDEGEGLIAIYHSHQTSPPYPSAVDAAKAFYPDSVYLIFSLQQPATPQLAGFFLRPELALEGNAAAKLLRDMSFVQVRPGLRSVHLPIEAPVPDGLRGQAPEQVAFYLIFDENDSRRAPIIRVVSIQPVDILIEI